MNLFFSFLLNIMKKITLFLFLINNLFQFINLYVLLLGYENGFFKFNDKVCAVRTFPNNK